SLELLPPEVLSIVLRHADNRARLRLRSASRTLERSIAASDFHNYFKDVGRTIVTPNRCKNSRRNVCFLLEGVGENGFVLRFGPQLVIRLPKFDSEKGKKLLHLRRRLFKTAYINTLCLLNINFHKVPRNFIDDLLYCCHYRGMRIIYDLHSPATSTCARKFLLDNAHKVSSISVKGLDFSREKLLSLPRMDRSFTVPCMYYDDDCFLQLLRKGHCYLDLPYFDFPCPTTIIEAFEIISASPHEQSVRFCAKPKLMEDVMALLHFDLTRRGYVTSFDTNPKYTVENVMGEDALWTGSCRIRRDDSLIIANMYSSSCNIVITNCKRNTEDLMNRME
ncbi:hypothetical protein PFISCL1PPCAC_1156, partial [Pristionchus fissidentatus]